jgi:hypothetical protein
MVLFLVVLASVLLTATICHADPLDDAGAKIGDFLQKCGAIAVGLIPAAGGLAISSLAIQRKLAKAAGHQDVVNRTSEQITEVLKLVAVGAGSSLLVAIAGSVLK